MAQIEISAPVCELLCGLEQRLQDDPAFLARVRENPLAAFQAEGVPGEVLLFLLENSGDEEWDEELELPEKFTA